jgi:hypothetical protein
VVDFVHVLEYLWRAAWCFFAEGDPDAETWVRAHALRLLQGRASVLRLRFVDNIGRGS